MREPLLREATPADAAAVCRVYRSAVLSLAGNGYEPGQLKAWAFQAKASTFRKPIQAGHVTVAERSGRLLGFASFDPEAGELNSLYVRRTARGMGVGRLLVGRVEEVARTRGLGEVGLNSSKAALGFYERLGFEPLWPFEYALRDGTKLPCVRMRKLLRGR